MRTTCRVVMLASALSLVAAAAAASSSVATATKLTIINQDATVQVVVSFSGATVASQNVTLVTGAIWKTGHATLTLTQLGTLTTAATKTASGVTAAVTRTPTGLRLALTTHTQRYVLIGYTTPRPPQLIISLWRAAPPDLNATILRDSCLMLKHVGSNPGVMTLGGTLRRRVFENTVAAIVRNARGGVIVQHSITARVGKRFTTVLHYHAVRTQTGTVQLVVLSPKDGSVTCLVQQAERVGA